MKLWLVDKYPRLLRTFLTSATTAACLLLALPARAAISAVELGQPDLGQKPAVCLETHRKKVYFRVYFFQLKPLLATVKYG